MTKLIYQRISDSFTDEQSINQAKEYKDSVYAAWKDVSTSLSRSAVLLFLLIAIFELLAYQRASGGISIGTFTIVNAPVVQIALPTVIAFILYDGIRLSVHWLDLESAYMILMRICAPNQASNALDILIKPSLPSLWAIGSSVSTRLARPGEKFIYPVNIAVSATAIYVVPIAFECQAYYRLIQKFHLHNAFLWVSMIVTALLLICGYIYAYTDGRSAGVER
jgi:hypothetical protein